jgi:hypothetical protein
LVRSAILSDDGVFLDGRVLSVGSPVNESSVGSVTVGAQISSGDVVSHTEDAVAVVSLDASFVGRSGEGDVEGVSETSGTVTQVVFSGPGSLHAERSGNTPWLLDTPGSTVGSARNWVVVDGGSTSLGSAITLSLNVLGLGLVELAIGVRGSQDGNISPGSGSPIGIVISLFGAFVSVSVSVVVLTGEDGSGFSSIQVSLLLTISNEETHVTVSVLAVLVVLVRFVHSIEQISISIDLGRRVGIIVDGIGSGTISNEGHGVSVRRRAHVLEDEVANHSGVVTTSVLVGPFDSQERSFVEGHRGTNAITSLSVVLGVEQSVSIVSVGVSLVQSVIGTTRAVHVKVTVDGAEKKG